MDYVNSNLSIEMKEIYKHTNNKLKKFFIQLNRWNKLAKKDLSFEFFSFSLVSYSNKSPTI